MNLVKKILNYHQSWISETHIIYYLKTLFYNYYYSFNLIGNQIDVLRGIFYDVGKDLFLFHDKS